MTARTNTPLFLAAFIAAFIFLASLVLAQVAAAGTYVVTGTCGAWSAFNVDPTRLAAFEQCPNLIARNVVGNFRTGKNTAGAGWRFTIPAGTALNFVNVQGDVEGGNSWSAKVVVDVGPSQPDAQVILADCSVDPGDPRFASGCHKDIISEGLPGYPGASIKAFVRCLDADGCDNSSIRGRVRITSSAITLSDPSPPTVGIAGGPLTGGGWLGHQTSIVLSGSDNTGIRAARAIIDGDAGHSTQTALPCDYGKPLPCANQGSINVPVDLSGLADGQHTLVGQADDAASNPGNTAPITINVDNTAPTAPMNARLVGGAGFQSRNQFGVTWQNPVQQFAPIAGARYTICPAGEPTSAQCTSGDRAGLDLSRIDGVQVPGPGAWTLRLQLYDAAGNSALEDSVTIGGLGLIAGREGHRRTTLTALHRSSKRHARATRTPSVGLGQPVGFGGRLTTGHGKHRRGLGGQELLIYGRTAVEGAQYHLTHRLRTGRRGSYRFRVPAGPSRSLQVVYPGGGRRQGRIATVHVHVRARLKLKARPRSLNNGQATTLEGRLHAGRIPAGGVPLEVQVRARGQWRPFATPRTDAKGRWSYPYRFETVQGGTARFRFRAVLKKQPNYPYTARSRAVKVRVLGT